MQEGNSKWQEVTDKQSYHRTAERSQRKGVARRESLTRRKRFFSTPAFRYVDHVYIFPAGSSSNPANSQYGIRVHLFIVFTIHRVHWFQPEQGFVTINHLVYYCSTTYLMKAYKLKQRIILLLMPIGIIFKK